MYIKISNKHVLGIKILVLKIEKNIKTERKTA
jgi:hypothetical protein